MKKTYTEPQAEVVVFEKKDVIAASADTTTTTTKAEGENSYENYALFL